MRAGIGCVSLDLPGHGARHDEDLHDPAAVLRIVEQMASEVDGAVESMLALGGFDPARIAIGGISAGGMAALVRTTSEHSFCAMTLESTTGDLRNRRSTKFADPARLERLNPITHLDNWRDVPLLALHNRLDEWVDVDGQLGFLDALRTRAKSPTAIEHHVYEKPTGAPFEHAGFGRFSADAKDRQVSFLTRIFFESNPR
jgi:alpha-beta hydrolase superfamily lysophospholipase